jgi:hypothetical protein
MASFCFASGGGTRPALEGSAAPSCSPLDSAHTPSGVFGAGLLVVLVA